MARRRIEVEIIGNPRSLGAALGKSVGMLDTFAARMRTVGSQLHSTGRTLTRGITLPVLATAGYATKLSLNFEDAMTHIDALVGASDKQMGRYREGVLALAEAGTSGPQALAESLYFITSAGFSGASALDVLEASARAADAGLGDLQTVADLTSSAVNVYGERALSASAATDVLTATVREGKAEPAELAEALGRVLAPAEAMKVSFAEVGGAVAGLTLGGLDAAEAVTGLRGILSTLIKPSQQARDTLDEAGLSVEGLRKQVADEGLLPALQDLRDRFGGNKDALGKLFPNVRALNAFLSLTGRNAKKNADAMKGVTDSVGDTTEAVNEASESAGFKLRKAWSQIQAQLIRVGDVVVPILADLAGHVKGVIAWFNNLSPSTKKMVVGLVLVAAAIGPILMMLGSLILLIGVIASPIGAIVIGLALLGAALVVLYTKSETFRRIAGQAWTYVQEQARRFVEWFQTNAMPAIQNVLDFLRALWARFGGAFIAIGKVWLGTIIGVIRANLQILRGIVEFFLAVLRGDWRGAWNALKTIVSGVWNLIKAIVRGAIGAVLTIVRELGTRLLSLAGFFLDKGLALGRAIIDGIVNAIKGAAGSIGSAIRSAIPDPGGGVPFVPGIQTGVRNFAGGLALVGERGPELVNLPRGSDVYTASRTRGMLGGERDSSLVGLAVEGRIDADGYMRGVVVSELDAVNRSARRRRRMGT